MKILFLAARICYPLNTGAKIRAFHLLRALAKDHDVTMVSYYGNKDEEKLFQIFAGMGVRLVPIYNPRIDAPPSASSVIRSLTGRLPLTIAKYYSREMADTVKKLCREGFDAIHCEHLHVFPMAIGNGLPVVLDEHNVESQIAGRYAAMEASTVKRQILGWNHRKLVRFEMDAVNAARLVLAVSAEDRSTFKSLGAGDNIRVIENGVDLSYFSPAGIVKENSLVFVGSMDWKPNIDGVEYFLYEILPIIRSTHPDVTVDVVGKAPPESIIKRGLDDKAVRVTGTVDDVRPYVATAAVCIVPLRVGGGTRLKVLEGFAMEKAVVSTTLGCEGIACVNGEHLIIADGADEFARAVVALMDNAGLRRTLGANGRRLAEREYDWQAIGGKMAGYYREFV